MSEHPPELVQQVAEALRKADDANYGGYPRRDGYRRMARAALDAVGPHVKLGGTPKPRVYTDADAEVWADYD